MISVDALVAYAEELEEAAITALATEDEAHIIGLNWLKDLRSQAISKIDAGGSGEYVESIVNGQKFVRSITGTWQEWFEVLQLAIKQFNGTAVKVVYARTSNPPH